MKRAQEPAFEDALSDDWSRDLDVAEVSIGSRPLWYLGTGICAMLLVVAGRIIYLNISEGKYYAARAEDNVQQLEQQAAPRGTIYDREGKKLAESAAAFTALLDTRAFIQNEPLRNPTIKAAEEILGINPADLAERINEAGAEDYAVPIILAQNLSQNQLVNIKALSLPTIAIENDYTRTYAGGPAFASLIGYTGRASREELHQDLSLGGNDLVGKAGVEKYYDAVLRGIPGEKVSYRDARGKVLKQEERSAPEVGQSLRLTIDAGFEEYFYNRLAAGLRSLGRTTGLGIAINPKNGEVLSLVNLPGYDNNVFLRSDPDAVAEVKRLLSSKDEPLFDRAVNGFYSPGSTIKPLVGVAALKEGVIDPSRTIFSNGFLLVPNPYNSSTPSKYVDWRYQGSVNLSSALAQSSDVYFYVVAGGSPPLGAAGAPLINDPSDYGIKGLGISRLGNWWGTFGLGKPTGIDMPNESEGFLPTPEWKEKKTGAPWLLGDTYNVAIGQGDLLVSPLQLLDYIVAIANGGKLYRPFLNASSTPALRADLADLAPQIAEVQKGMRAGVSAPQGTAHLLNDLPVCVAAKTGSAQVENNAQENALFVGYAPCDDPQVAILILIEHSKEGSLNAVPIAKDVLNWYYGNRIAGRG